MSKRKIKQPPEVAEQLHRAVKRINADAWATMSPVYPWARTGSREFDVIIQSYDLMNQETAIAIRSAFRKISHKN